MRRISGRLGGAWDLPAIDIQELANAGAVIERYADQNIRIADASNVILAERNGTRTIVTLDHRHFDVCGRSVVDDFGSSREGLPRGVDSIPVGALSFLKAGALEAGAPDRSGIRERGPVSCRDFVEDQ